MKSTREAGNARRRRKAIERRDRVRLMVERQLMRAGRTPAGVIMWTHHRCCGHVDYLRTYPTREQFDAHRAAVASHACEVAA
ncbi:hypothetical protein HMPREF0063_10092 [Aeromicrobium marinum DSM 15272]|uniref:Uncharacterized protein n=1 Tax=Aeromicrobium marinum DSM 15272 TaxID=585531 RepID=E2S7T5_9ACTN|nr:hypothetical protein [Aeromicrobium marinum]EFQ84751.1 hypothetical protein HMPREF0063_10092 [Aeromicrobium marinum DSM 15272]